MTSSETIAGLGSREDVVAPIPARDLARLQLSADEALVIAAIGRPTPLGEFLERLWLPREDALALLSSLKKKGAIVFSPLVKVKASPGSSREVRPPVSAPHPTGVRGGSALAADAEGRERQTPARVASAAQASAPVEVPLSKPAPPAPRAESFSSTAPESPSAAHLAALEERLREVRELEARLDTLDHFALLGIKRGASSDEIKRAYYDASRRFHPDRFFGAELGADKVKVERLFKRVSEAQLVLSDPKRRASYEAAHPPAAGDSVSPSFPAGAPMNEERVAERRSRLLRHPYLAKSSKAHELIKAARASLERGDPAGAVADLVAVMQLEPRNAEAPGLLTEAKRRLAKARAKEQIGKGLEAERQGDRMAALKHFRGALAHDEGNATALFKGAQLLAAAGDGPEEARLMARKAVEADPSSADARALLGGLLLDVDKPQAKIHLEEALRLAPQHPEAKKHAKKLRWPF